jgi:hypothetical protein
MAVYTVHEPPPKRFEQTSDPERFAFVRDGFSFAAFMFGPLWMLSHRMWLALVGYVGVSSALEIIFACWTRQQLQDSWRASFSRSRLEWRRRRSGGSRLAAAAGPISVIVADDLEAANAVSDVWVKSGGAAPHDERVAIAAARASARCHRPVSRRERNQGQVRGASTGGSGNCIRPQGVRAARRAKRHTSSRSWMTGDPDVACARDRGAAGGRRICRRAATL